MIDKRLSRAFDLQRFEGNDRLQSVIDAAHRRLRDRESVDGELSEEELDLVSAAGTAYQPPNKKVTK